MSAYSVTEPSTQSKGIAASLVILYALITMIPLIWIMMTGFKSPDDAISYPPKVIYQPTLEGYVNLFTTRTRQTQEFLEANPPETGQMKSCASTTWLSSAPPNSENAS